MVKAVMGEDGQVLQALEKGDLDRAVTKFLRWFFMVVIPFSVYFLWTLSAYAAENVNVHKSVNERLVRDSIFIMENKASIAENRQMLRQIDSLRFEVRRLTDEMQTTNKILRSR